MRNTKLHVVSANRAFRALRVIGDIISYLMWITRYSQLSTYYISNNGEIMKVFNNKEGCGIHSISILAEINQTIVVGWITSSNIILNCSISRGIYAE